MKKTYLIFQLVVYLLICHQLSAQIPVSQVKHLTVLHKTALLDVKVTHFLFKKVDKDRKVVPFTNKDTAFLKGYFLQKEGIISVRANSTDKTIEVVSILQRNGKVLFQHRQERELLQKMGYITTKMHCKVQKQHIPVESVQNNQEVKL